MMKFPAVPTAVLAGAALLLLGSACGTSDEDLSLSRYAIEARQTLDAMDQAAREHHAAVLGSDDPEAIRAEEGRYAETMHGHWDDLDRLSTGLEACGPMGGGMHDEAAMRQHMGGFHDRVHALDGVFEDHWQEMEQAADLAAMHTHEGAHFGEWTELRDRMAEHHEAWEADGDAWTCPDFHSDEGHHHDGDWGGHMGGWGGHMGGR